MAEDNTTGADTAQNRDTEQESPSQNGERQVSDETERADHSSPDLGESAESPDTSPTDGESVEVATEEKLKEQVADLEDRLLRAAAEFDNYKKRSAARFEQMNRSAGSEILLEFLEVVDSFERGLEHANDETDRESMRQGMELIYNQLTSILSKHDVTPIEAIGKPFDPNLHEALMYVESEDYPEGTVAVEVKKGYRRGSRVLRHSKVGVSKGKAEEQ